MAGLTIVTAVTAVRTITPILGSTATKAIETAVATLAAALAMRSWPILAALLFTSAKADEIATIPPSPPPPSFPKSSKKCTIPRKGTKISFEEIMGPFKNILEFKDAYRWYKNIVDHTKIKIQIVEENTLDHGTLGSTEQVTSKGTLLILIQNNTNEFSTELEQKSGLARVLAHELEHARMISSVGMLGESPPFIPDVPDYENYEDMFSLLLEKSVMSSYINHIHHLLFYQTMHRLGIPPGYLSFRNPETANKKEELLDLFNPISDHKSNVNAIRECVTNLNNLIDHTLSYMVEIHSLEKVFTEEIDIQRIKDIKDKLKKALARITGSREKARSIYVTLTGLINSWEKYSADKPPTMSEQEILFINGMDKIQKLIAKMVGYSIDRPPYNKSPFTKFGPRGGCGNGAQIYVDEAYVMPKPIGKPKEEL